MNNFVEEYKNALSGDVCDFLINKFEENINLASPGMVGSGVVKKEIKSTLDLNFLNRKILKEKELNNTLLSIVNVLREKIKEYFLKYEIYKISQDPKSKDFMQEAVWNRFVIHHGGIHMKKYMPEKDYYHWHVDTSVFSPEYFCRKLVMMFYLNDVEEGGETGFLNQKLLVKPTKGSLVIFPADFTGKHRGLTPKSGVKYIINSWLLELIDPLIPEIIATPKKYFYLNREIIEIIKNK